MLTPDFFAVTNLLVLDCKKDNHDHPAHMSRGSSDDLRCAWYYVHYQLSTTSRSVKCIAMHNALPQYGHWPRNCQTRGGVRCKPIRQVAPLDAASNTVYNSRSHICNRLLVSISRSVASCSLCTEKNSSKSVRDALRYPANAWWSVCLSTLKCRTKHWPIDVIDVSIGYMHFVDSLTIENVHLQNVVNFVILSYYNFVHSLCCVPCQGT